MYAAETDSEQMSVEVEEGISEEIVQRVNEKNKIF